MLPREDSPRHKSVAGLEGLLTEAGSRARSRVPLRGHASAGGHQFAPGIAATLYQQFRPAGKWLRTVLSSSSEESEFRFVFTLPAKPVDLAGDSEHAEPVGIVQRHGKAQDRELPGPQHLAVLFDRASLTHL
jgi:hypothetical protein